MATATATAVETEPEVATEMATKTTQQPPARQQTAQDRSIIAGHTVWPTIQRTAAWIAPIQNQIIVAMQHSKGNLEEAKKAAEWSGEQMQRHIETYL